MSLVFVYDLYRIWKFMLKPHSKIISMTFLTAIELAPLFEKEKRINLAIAAKEDFNAHV